MSRADLKHTAASISVSEMKQGYGIQLSWSTVNRQEAHKDDVSKFGPDTRDKKLPYENVKGSF